MATWGLDFVRAAGDMSLLRRVLFRLALNRHAAKEFSGLMNEMARNGFWPYSDYGLENWGLYTPRLPFRWWKERSWWPVSKPSERD